MNATPGRFLRALLLMAATAGASIEPPHELERRSPDRHESDLATPRAGREIGAPASHVPGQTRYILLNIRYPAERDAFERIRADFTTPDDARVQVGVSAIFSYLHQPREQTVADLTGFLQQARETGTPVVVQLDGENWWGARPDLWNWWDPDKPGYSPGNRVNVEWTSWSPSDAIKIAWRHWGRQIRVLPPPNLMSPRYRAACHEEMRVLVPLVLDWWKALPEDQKHLFVGLKLGWESSIGVNAWYYPGGNTLLDRPVGEDPRTGLTADEVPARGVAQIGFAAVKTAGLRTGGTITEADLAEIVRRHLEDLCRLSAAWGVPRDRLFTHVAGWKEKELLYQSALNSFSCPGWSFYQHARDPAGDAGVQEALRQSDAPYWAAVEWLLQGSPDVAVWKSALAATLLQPRCRFLCIFNWRDVRDNREAIQAIRETTAEMNQSNNQ